MSKNTAEVVAPLNTLTPKDVQNSKQKIDQWLRAHTDNYINLERMETVARNIPALGSVFAAVDVITDITQIYDKGIQAADITDWVNLGIDAIAIIPAPATATVRTMARPALFLVREEVRRITKNGVKKFTKEQLGAAIQASVINVIAAHLNSELAGSIEKFAENGQANLNALLNQVGNWVQDATTKIDSGLREIVEKGVIAHPSINYDRAKIQGQAVIPQIKNGEVLRGAKNAYYFVENNIKGNIKVSANGVTKASMLIIPAQYKAKILQLGTNIKNLGVTSKSKITALGNANTALSIGWLFSVLLAAAKKHKKDANNKSAQIKQNQISEAKKRNPDARLEKQTSQKSAENNANACKNCMGSTKHRITYALGTEFLTHVDAQIAGMIPESIQRTYVSNLYQLDDSIFGHRWITPFNTKIARKFNYDPNAKSIKTKQKGLQYIGVDGRAIDLPELQVGQSIYNSVEGYTYTVLSEQLHLIAYGQDEKRFYEKSGDDYRLAYIERQHGFKVALRYDHILENQHIVLSDIIFKQDRQELAHLALKINARGLVSDIWMVKQGQLDRVLASYDYDEHNDLIRATTEFAASYHYTYQHHLITRYTDLTQRGMNIKWDGILPSAKAIEEWADNASSAAKLEWDQNVRKTYVTDVEGNTTEHFYDIDGYTYRIVYPDHSQEWFFRDDAKNITLHMATDGSETLFSYDERSNLITNTQANGATSYFEYDDKDQLIGMVDAEQGRWFKQYDGSGNLIKEIDPLKHETAYAYNSMGLVTSITDAKGGSKTLKYDDQGNLLSYTDCSGKEIKWDYDDHGRVKSVENALKQKVEYFYSELTTAPRQPIAQELQLNAFGQLEKIQHVDGTSEHFVHDAEGRLLVHIDQKGQQTRYEYDEAGLILSRTDALNQKLRYQWDRLGRLTRLINENGGSYQFFYDLGGRLIKEIDFDSKETIYQYDESNGHLTTSIEVASVYGQSLKDRAAPKDRIQQFIFDSMGRLEQRRAGYGHQGLTELEQAQTEEFSYDFLGNLIQAKNAESNLQWFYDAASNLTREHQQDYQTQKTAVWKHRYDELNQRTQTIRPDGQQIDWLSYGSGHIYGLALNGEDLVSFERDDLHRETLRHYANGISQQQHYDAAGRLSQQSILNGHEQGYHSADQRQTNAIQDTQQLVQRLYQYDKTGELTHTQDTRRGQLAYKYDPVGRLLEASSKLGKETFRFDPASNLLNPDQYADRQKHTQTSEEPSYGYNRLVNNVVQAYLDQQYQYDAYGQLIRQKTSRGDLNLEWDVYGRLIKSRNHKYTAEYRYDALGRRIHKRSQHHHTGNEQHTVYGWDGDTLAYESTEQATKHYIYEKDSFVPLLQAIYTAPIALHPTPDWSNQPYHIRRDPLWRMTQQSPAFEEVCFYHCDHLGTPQEMSDTTGTLVWKAQYKAWGECKAEQTKSSFFENSEIISNNIRFQGQYFDEETGLHYNRYRYYSPDVGRFISKDPIGLLGGFNVYQYAPNPVGWIDPLGLNSKNCSNAYAEALKKAEEIRNNGGRLPTATCAVVNKRTGKVYYGTSGSKPENIHADLGVTLPSPSLEPWAPNNCAEVDAVNKALKDGSNRKDLEIATVRTRSGEAFPCCKNCQVTFKYDKVLTGKK